MNFRKFSTVLVIFACSLLICLNRVSVSAQITDATNPTKKAPASPKKTNTARGKNSRRKAPSQTSREKTYQAKPEVIIKYKMFSSLVIATLPNADISLTSIDKKTQFNKTDRTDSEGTLILKGLPPGKYKLLTSLKGYQSNETEILIPPEETIFRPVKLEIASSDVKTQPNADEKQKLAVEFTGKEIKTPAAIERETWESIKNSANPADFDSFLKKFPRGMNAARAKIRREQLIWESVKDSQDVKKIQDYLREFPGGKNAVLAKNKILQLTKPAQTSDAKPPSKTEAAAKQTVLTEIASKRTPKTKDNSAALPAVNTANKETTKTESDFRNNNAGKGAVVHNSVETNPDSDDKTTAKNGNPAAVNQNSLSVDKLPEANPLSAAQHLEKCQEFIKSEKLNEALQSCTSAIELNPRNELAYSLRGNIYMIKVNFDLAVKDFNEAIILNPKNPTSFFNRGNSFFLVKKFSEAIEDYTKSIEIAPENPLYYSNRGLAYSNKKDYTKSASDFTVAIGLGWTPASIFIARGQSYYALNKFDEAIADFTRAIVIAPNNANIYRERANAYLARANSAAKNKNRNLDIEKAQIDNKLAETVEKRNP